MKTFRLILLSLLSYVFTQNIIAQNSEFGIPPSYIEKVDKEVPVVEIAKPDVEFLLKEDEIRASRKDIPFRYGFPIDVSINTNNSGKWDTLSDGYRIWRVAIHAEDAISLNLKYSKFRLPDGGKMYLYNLEKSALIGAFTKKNNRYNGDFSTGILPGNTTIIEYIEPTTVEEKGQIEVSKVIYGYKDLYNKRLGDCYIDIVCPEGASWQMEKKAVARIALANGLACTGTLLNNVRQDGRQFFLTANHCYEASNDVANWDFYFNNEAGTCGGFAPYVPSVDGSVLIARNPITDFCLLEITSLIPVSQNPYFAGWSNIDISSDSVVVIHHPGGSSKKISFDFDYVISSSWGSTQNTHWTILDYDISSTEGGSSGSALWDKNHRVIGQLQGGNASCDNNDYDKYGKFARSWNIGSTSTTRLRDWLDPNNSGIQTLNGWSPGNPNTTLDAQLFEVLTPVSNYCTSSDNSPQFIVRNLGSSPITSLTISYTLDNAPAITKVWNGNLACNQTDTVRFPYHYFNQGNHIIKAYISNVNGVDDEFRYNDTLTVLLNGIAGELFELDITGRKYYEDEIQWSIINSNNSVLFSGGPYTTPYPYTKLHINEQFCLTEDCYKFTIQDNNCGGNSPGYYIFTNLTEEDTLGSGCNTGTNDIINFCVSLNQSAVADFYASDTSVCSGDSILFADASVAATSWFWTFEGGSPGYSVLQNPKVKYDLPGFYFVKLCATNAFGSDSVVRFDYVQVLGLPEFSVSATNASGISAADGSCNILCDSCAYPVSYLWSTNATTQQITGLSPGYYSVTVTDKNLCSSSEAFEISFPTLVSADYSISIWIQPNPAKNFLYLNSPEMPLGEISIYAYDGKSIIKTFSDSNNFTLDLKSFSNGVYFIHLKSKTSSVVKKLLIIK